MTVDGRSTRSTSRNPYRCLAGTLNGKMYPSTTCGTLQEASNTVLISRRQPPPTDSKPEALNFPVTHYSMSDDAAPYIPPQRYPSPPKNMWYEVPKEPPGPAPKPVFPWEGHQPRPSRSFPVDPFAPSQAEPADAQPGKHDTVHSSQTDTEASHLDSPAADTGSNPQTPSTPTVMVTPPPAADWNSFQHSNAWDEIPEINRYVDGFQKFHRRGRSGGSVPSLASPVPRGPGRRPKPSGFKLTDFPTAVERPSLPVTPAPVTGSSSYWAHGEAEDEVGHASSNALPAAQGVPAQSDWVCVHGRRWRPSDCLCDLTDMAFVQKNPEERLRELSKLQHAALLRKLSNQDGATDEAGSGHRVIPKRSLPFGSQDFKSPTYVQQAPHAPVISAPRPPASLGRDTSGSTLIGRPATPRWAPGLDSSQDPLLESPLSDPRT